MQNIKKWQIINVIIVIVRLILTQKNLVNVACIIKILMYQYYFVHQICCITEIQDLQVYLW